MPGNHPSIVNSNCQKRNVTCFPEGTTPKTIVSAEKRLVSCVRAEVCDCVCVWASGRQWLRVCMSHQWECVPVWLARTLFALYLSVIVGRVALASLSAVACRFQGSLQGCVIFSCDIVRALRLLAWHVWWASFDFKTKLKSLEICGACVLAE